MKNFELKQLIKPVGFSILVSVLYALAAYFTFLASNQNDIFLMLLTHSFLWGIPLGLSAFVSFFAPERYRGDLMYGALVSGLTVMIFFGVVLVLTLGLLICFVVFLPVMVGAAVIGGLFFSALMKIFNNRNTTMGLVLIPLMAIPWLTAPLEVGAAAPDQYRVVRSSVVVRADPDTIWANIVRVAEITPEEQPFTWFHLMGIPRPVEAVMDGEGLAASRYGYFNNGLVFTEEITVWEPGRKITFDILANSLDSLPEPINQIGGRYFEVLDATYEIEPLGDGLYRLNLSSTHRLSTHVNGYTGWWTDKIMGDFQMYLLEIIKNRVEIPVPTFN